MTYLIESSSCLIALYAFYYLLLRKKNFHKWNRFYLLGSILLSCLIPTLSIPTYETVVIVQNVSNTFSPISGSRELVTQSSFDWTTLLPITYFIIVLVMLIPIVLEVTKLFRIISTSKTVREHDLTKVLIENDLPISSFFHFLFVSEDQKITEYEYRHELAHIEQYHSIDKLLIAVIKAIYWFNPIIYMYRKSLNELHEYLADEAVLEVAPPKQYLSFLKFKIEQQYNYALVNPFNSLIKNRLTMINQKTRSSKRIFLMALPVFLTLISIFSCESYITAQELTDEQSILSEVEKSQKTAWLYPPDEIPTLQRILENAELIPEGKNCQCKGVNLLYAAKDKDIVRVVNNGPKFNLDSNRLLSNAQAGDKYLFDNIKLDCNTGIESVGQLIISITDIESARVVTKAEISESNAPQKYKIYSDTITYFDEDTYKETVRVIDIYETKERYEAYQKALALERYIFIRNTYNDQATWSEILYVDIDEYLKNTAPNFMNENGTYVYDIHEKGELVKTSEPFTLADLRR